MDYKVYFIVLGFIIFDILSGLLKATYEGKYNSSVMRKGGLRKLSEVFALILSGLLEYVCAFIDLGVELPLLPIVSVYICVMELISILENLCAISPILNNLFKPYLAKLKEGYKHDEEGD